jgi:hypothetical protein
MVMNLIRGGGTHVAEKQPRCPHYVIGLDLGQASDYTALCIMDRHVKKVGRPRMHRLVQGRYTGAQELAEWRTDVENIMTVRHLDRPRCGRRTRRSWRAC